MTYQAKVKATNEDIIVYPLKNGNFYDYQAMGQDMPPSAKVANKKEFTPEELFVNKQS